MTNDFFLKKLSQFKSVYEMNRREKREYRRFLDKNNLWDGYFVLQNQKRMGILKYGKDDE
jgi:hypothetical protein